MCCRCPRFDDSEVPGLSRDLDYLRAENYSPAELAAMIAEKLGIKPFQGKGTCARRAGRRSGRKPQRQMPWTRGFPQKVHVSVDD